MKTPKEKAEELVGKMYDSTFIIYDEAKQCAIIAVDEIIIAIDWHEFETPNKEIEYWQLVKQEIHDSL